MYIIEVKVSPLGYSKARSKVALVMLHLMAEGGGKAEVHFPTNQSPNHCRQFMLIFFYQKEGKFERLP